MASSLPSLQVRKGSAVNEFLGRDNGGSRYWVVNDVKHGRAWARAPPPHARTCHIYTQTSQYVAFSHISLLTSLLLLYIPSYVTISLTPFYTTHTPCPPQQQLPSGSNKTIHNQGVGERSEPHSLYIAMHACMLINCYVYIFNLTLKHITLS